MSLYTKIIDLQKLNIAWNKARKNKPASGVDNITYEMFDERKRVELKQLQLELQSHEYETLPVKEVMLYKGEKARRIALYSMRDKVVQQSVAAELNSMYDKYFAEAVYAYRNNKSALVALENIENEIQKNIYNYFLKADISHFFDNIIWEQLESILRQEIVEEDVLSVIKQNSATRVLDDTGEILEKYVGIHQGSGLSPILSNIYMMDFDNWLSEKNIFYVRYSDDILILGESKEMLLELLTEIRTRLGQKGLKINERKTQIVEFSEGIEFLGHAFNENGKSIPAKAIENLNNRLEMMWLTSEDTFEDKLKKAMQIIGGWEQYFDENRKIESIFEFIALFNASQNSEEYRKVLYEERTCLNNIYKDIAIYLGKLWSDYDRPEAELYEYEQFFQIAGDSYSDYKESHLKDLISFYRNLLVLEEEDLMTERKKFRTVFFIFN